MERKVPGKRKGHGNGRTPSEAAKLALRRQEAFRRFAAGESQKSIAAALGVSQAVISLDIARAWNDWRVEHRGSISEHVEMELQQINAVQLRAETMFGKKPSTETLKVMLQCIHDRRELLGMDAPSRQHVQAEVTSSRTFIPKQEMLEQVQRAVDRIRRSKAAEDNRAKEQLNGQNAQ